MMELDVSQGFLHPATAFPFEASLTLEAQDVGGETVTFDPIDDPDRRLSRHL